MISNTGSLRSGALRVASAQVHLPVLVMAAMALGGCSSNSLHMPTMPWTQSKPVATRPSPYAPVAIGPPLSPPPPENTDQYGDSIDSVVASVDGSPITNYDVQNPGPGTVNSVTGSAPSSGLDRDSVLKELIAQQLLDQEAQKYADKVDEADVERFIQQVEERNHLTDAQLRAQLQAQGLSYEAFRKNAFKQVETAEMVEREIRQKIQIPDSDIEAYYKDHPEEFSVTEEKYQLAQILIAVPAGAPADKVGAAQRKADEVHALALKGKDFGELARQY
jgi:peptidyl-prolyl cis-trans isomerase SurA